MISIGLTAASPVAISICAPYGSMLCMQQENVSSMLALFLLSTPNLSPISFDMVPTVRMATVLFAVHTFTMLTSEAIVSSQLLLLLILFVIKRIR